MATQSVGESEIRFFSIPSLYQRLANAARVTGREYFVTRSLPYYGLHIAVRADLLKFIAHGLQAFYVPGIECAGFVLDDVR